MNDEVMRMARDELVPAKQTKGLAKQAKKVYEQARLDVFENQLTMRKAGDAMTGVKNLHDHMLGKAVEGDIILNRMLLAIENLAFKEVVENLEGRKPEPKKIIAIDMWDLS